MRLLTIMAVAALMTLGLYGAAGVTGTWKGSMDTQMGPVEMTITLQSGAALTGTVKSDQFEAPIEKATLEADKIHFEINIEHGKVVFDGTVAGDELKFTVTGTTGNKYPLNCKRQS